ENVLVFFTDTTPKLTPKKFLIFFPTPTPQIFDFGTPTPTPTPTPWSWSWNWSLESNAVH
ncbi:unnamed protein product, partial [Rotaria sp. Silwood2]